jgi:glycosyltransferase involved in cell wall biosynthesis
MKISIITPSLNSADFLDEAIRSVLNQSDRSFEHIVIDGISTDATLDIIRRYPHLKWVSEKDRSKTEAVNKGLKLADGDILTWLCADDALTPHTFQRVRDYFQTHPECQVLVGRAKVIDKQGKVLFDQEETKDVTHEGLVRFWKNPLLPQPSLFFRRRILKEVGYLDEAIPSYMDYDYFLRISRSFRIQKCGDFFSLIRLHDGSESVRHIADGTRDGYFYRISRRYWKGGDALSYIWHAPGLAWRRHYDKFAFAARKKTGVFNGRDFRSGEALKITPLFFRYPLPFMVSSVKMLLRRFRGTCA